MWESWNHFDVYLFLYAFLMFGWLAFVIFKIFKFIAFLRVHVCAVACIGLEMLHNTSHWILLNYFVNKSYGSLLMLNFPAPEKHVSRTLSDLTFQGWRVFLNSPTLASQGSGLTPTIRFHESFRNLVKNVTLGTSEGTHVARKPWNG
jgi:hypothetical protein